MHCRATQSLEMFGKVVDWTGVFVHADMSVICLCVDDFMMVATEELEKRHWAEIGEHT